MSQFRVNVGQINTKRSWLGAAQRAASMIRTLEQQGAQVITLNELSREQAAAIAKLSGWEIFWTVNDRLRRGGWAGNAVAWKNSEFELRYAWAQPTVIKYRRGLKHSRRRGPWREKTVNQACVHLRAKRYHRRPLIVQAFHYPTRFNSDQESRKLCADRSASFAASRIDTNRAVILGGDSNGLFPKTDGLRIVQMDGPDGILTNGRRISGQSVPFRRRRLSDHNGVIATVEFDETL